MNQTGKTAGAILIFGSIQFIIAMIMAEALYPGYSISDNWISDLGVGSTALIFNLSIILFGSLVIAASYIIFKKSNNIRLTGLLFLAGAGAVMVGLFPEDQGLIHVVAAATAFMAGGLTALISFWYTEPPFRWFSIFLGTFSLAAMALYISGVYMGIGPGGMERLIAYPIILWLICYGGYLTVGTAAEADVRR